MKTLTLHRLDALDYATNEALNTLCTNLSFAGSSVKKIMLTSCEPQEGKSFISVNLMRTLAEVGKRVVLVDGDLRRSVLAGRYGVHTAEQFYGLTHYLAGMCHLDDVIFETNIPGAHMILAGHDVANSLPLLNTPRLSEMLDTLAEAYDVVLVDAPPVGVIIDAAQIARSCDGVLFVVSHNAISRRQLNDATRQINQTGCPIIGAVLNKVTFDSHASSKYYQKSYYSHYNKNYAREGRKKSKRGQRHK